MTTKRHILIAVGLLGFSSLIQVAIVLRSTTTGLDAVSFVRMAQSIDQDGLLPTVRTHRQQPLFPAWLWVVHQAVRSTAGELCVKHANLSDDGSFHQSSAGWEEASHKQTVAKLPWCDALSSYLR